MDIAFSPVAQRWFISLPVAFVCVSLCLRIGGMRGKTKLGSAEADVMSFELVAAVSLVHLAYHGVGIWFQFFGDLQAVVDGGVYTESTVIRDSILIPMLAYQSWNLAAGLYLKEFGDFPSLAHHAVTIGISYFTITGPVFHYYAVYFLGVSEVSTIPLTFPVDIFAKFPRYQEQFPMLNTVGRLLFATLFMITRVIYFPILDYFFWTECYQLYMSAGIREYFPVVFFLVANIFMTGLQFFWGAKMFGFITNTLKGPPEKKRK